MRIADPGTPTEWLRRKAFLLSFFKRKWELEDYPLAWADQAEGGRALLESGRIQRWRLYIVGKPVLSGCGDSQKEAMASLRSNYESWVADNHAPRPGTKFKGTDIQFATATRIEMHPELVQDFITRVLGYEWAWITDESSLWDFHTEATNELLVRKVQEVYDVDISDLPSSNIADILDRIAHHRNSAAKVL